MPPVFDWNGRDLPPQLRDLPPGRYVVEAAGEALIRASELEGRLAEAGVDTFSFVWHRRMPDPTAGLSVPGDEAILLWARLRALLPATGFFPVVTGSDERTRRVFGHYSFAEPTAALLERVPASFDPTAWARERVDEFLEWARGRDEELTERLEWSGRYLAGAEPRCWPEVRRDERFWIPLDLLSRRPHDRVHVALVPTTVPWLAPIFLRFGGFNACPEPPIHAAFLRAWAEEFGAEPVGMGHDMLELRVGRPVAERRRAMRLAVEQWGYDGDVWGDAVRSDEGLAAWLLGARTWTFWWD